jgi:tetratricopeptide (TPR) repeat protein
MPADQFDSPATSWWRHRAPLDLNDRRYPRRGPLRVIREALLFCWGIIGVYLSGVTWNLYQLAHVNPDRLANRNAVLAALLLPGPLTRPRTPFWDYGVVGLVFVLLLWGCIWATRDMQHEHKVMHARALREVVSAGLERKGSGMAHELHGPPFDEALLPLPDHFVGRVADLEWLLARLRMGRTAGVTALSGMGGIGKTALAALAVRRLRAEGRFRDGIAVIPCQGQTDETEVLRATLSRFDPHRRQPDADDPAVLADTARHLLDGKDALIVLDNIEPALPVAQVVLPLRAAGATLLLTARQALPRSVVPVGASRVLGLLSTHDALALFAQSSGHSSTLALTPAEYAAARRIVSALGRHTLAVRLAGAYAADLHRHLGIMARELENPQRAIELPDGETPRAVAVAFAESVEALPPDAHRLFVALAAFATEAFGRHAALMLAGRLGLAAPEASVNLLVLRALVDATVDRDMPEQSDRERLRLHPLLRAFAAVEFARWPPEERDAAHCAVARYYTQYIQRIKDTALVPDEANVLGALTWARDHDQHELVAAICLRMETFWRDRWRTAASLRYLPWGLAAARAVASATRTRQARLRAASLAFTYGQALQMAAKFDEAEEALQISLAIRREMPDRPGEGVVLYWQGRVARERGRLEKAEISFQQALACARATSDRQGEGAVLIALGQIARARGRFADAESFFQASLAICREVGDWQDEGIVQYWLGRMAYVQGRLEGAETSFRASLALRRAVGDQRGEGVIHYWLGRVAREHGRLEEAAVELRTSLALRRAVGDRRGEGIILTMLGQIAAECGRLDGAKHAFQEALVIAREAQDRQGEIVIRSLLSHFDQIHGSRRQHSWGSA